MEGHDPRASVLVSIHPDLGFLRAVRAAATVATFVGLSLLVAMTATGIAGGPVFLLVIPVFVLAATLSRGNVAEARVTTAGLDLVGHDGVVRSIPGPAIGGIGTAGALVSGRLIAVPLGLVPSSLGRIVVIDCAGRVICARRAGWMRVADIHALAAAGGVSWLGTVRRQVPGASLPPPPGMDAPLPDPARDDPATSSALDRVRRRVRHLWLGPLGGLVAAVGAFFLLDALPEGHDVRGYLGWLGTVGILAAVFGSPLVALYGEHARWARRTLRKGQHWWPVEAVVVSGLVTDASARVVGIVDHATGDAEWWSVKEGGKQGWLQGDDRTAFWFLPGTRGRKALIAPPDRSHVAVLERKLLGKIAEAEARSQMRSEAMEWQARRAWAAWGSEQPDYSG